VLLWQLHVRARHHESVHQSLVGAVVVCRHPADGILFGTLGRRDRPAVWPGKRSGRQSGAGSDRDARSRQLSPGRWM